MATSKFGQAFAAARKAGKKAFTFNGKSYHTRTREEEATRKSAANTKKVSTSAGKKIAARAKTPNTTTRTVAKAPKPKPARPKLADAPKNVAPSSKVGQRGSAMLKAGTMPGRKKTAAANTEVTKPTPRRKAKTRGRGIGARRR